MSCREPNPPKKCTIYTRDMDVYTMESFSRIHSATAISVCVCPSCGVPKKLPTMYVYTHVVVLGYITFRPPLWRIVYTREISF